MNIAELYEIHLSLIETLDRIYEMWIAITFAVVVATTMGSKFLNTPLRVFITLLYLLVSSYLVLRLSIMIDLIVRAATNLTEAGEPVLSPLTAPMAMAGTATFWVGIAGTLYVIWRRYESDAGT